MIRVLIPRAGTWGEQVASLVSDAGFEPVTAQLIQVEPVDDDTSLRLATDALAAGKFDWLVVTSQSALRFLPRIPASVSVAAVGNVTAAALRDRGVPIAFVPRKQSAAGLVDEWPIPSGRVLWPHSELAKPTVKLGLEERGMHVTSVVAYQTKPGVIEASEIGEVDAVLVTSGSVAKQVLALSLTPRIVIATGEQTAEDCERAGLAVSAIASSPTQEALVAALTAATAALETVPTA